MKILFNYFVLIVLTVSFSFSHSYAQNIYRNENLTLDYHKALYLAGAQKYDEAIKNLKEIIEQDPLYYKAYKKIIDIYQYKKSLKEAKQYFERLQNKNPENPCVYHALGLVYKREKNYKEAYQKILKSIQIDNAYYPGYPDFVLVNKDYSEAEEMISAVVAAKPDLAAAHYGLAFVYSLKYEWQKELHAAGKAVSLNKELREARILEIEALYALGEYKDALDECNQELQVSEKKGDLQNTIELLQYRSLISNKLNASQDAIRYSNQALNLARKIGAKKTEGDVLSTLTRIYWYLSQYKQALQCARKGLKIELTLGDKSSQASNLNYMGVLSDELGNYSQALEYYQQAKDLYEEINNKGGAAICSGNIANLHLAIGNNDKTILLIDQIIDTFDELGSGWQKYKANYLGVLGDAHKNLTHYDQAHNAYQRSLKILKSLQTEPHQISSLLNKIGELYQEKGEYSKALDYYRQGLNVNARIFKRATKAEGLMKIANLYNDMDDLRLAQVYYKKAHDIGNKIKNSMIIWRSKAGLASIYKKQGKYNLSYTRFAEAIQHIEDIRNKLEWEELKEGFLSRKINVYENFIDLLYMLHLNNPQLRYVKKAFHLAERVKARTLLDIIYQGRIFNHLHEISEEFKQKLALNNNRIEKNYDALSREISKREDEQDKDLIASLMDEQEVLQKEKSRFIDEIVNKYPNYRHLTHPKLLSIEGIRENVLAANQVLIEYLVGDDNLFVWILTDNKMSFERISINRHELKEKIATTSPLFERGKTDGYFNIDHRWANLRPELLHELFNVLIKDVISGLKKGQELIIVPDDILFYFPFDILVTDFGDDTVRFLIEDHPISYSSSASLLNPALERNKYATNDLVAFGNPDFGDGGNKSIFNWMASMIRNKVFMRGQNFAQLPHAEKEVKEIVKFFPKSDAFTGRSATEEKFKDLAGEYRLIHLATHNLVDDVEPMYSKIVLAQIQTKISREDGFVQAYEIFNLKLNANLVVLSGCNTGLGKLRRGEGVIGMTRAFLYAGVSNLVVSLWPVNDESTALLMKHFYRHLKNGMPKNQALQKAKIMLVRSNDWQQDPFYWGPFILIGND